MGAHPLSLSLLLSNHEVNTCSARVSPPLLSDTSTRGLKAMDPLNHGLELPKL
jgi:hypothetical protein